jgi:hypothetical protein
VRVPTHGVCCDKISACRFLVLKSISRFFIHEEKNHTKHREPEYLDTHTEVSNHTHQFPPSVTSQHSLVIYVIDNNLLTSVCVSRYSGSQCSVWFLGP